MATIGAAWGDNVWNVPTWGVNVWDPNITTLPIVPFIRIHKVEAYSRTQIVENVIMLDRIYTFDPEKDPTDVLDYKTDFAPKANSIGRTDWLEPGEIINTFTVTVPLGINLHDGVTMYDGVIQPAPYKSDIDTSVIFWLSGGAHLSNYLITVDILTSKTRRLIRSRLIKVRIN